jgi:acyl-CoA synthetase (NDP forming)
VAGTHSALLAQAGVIEVPTLAELFHVGLLLERQPLPAGPRVAIVANAAQPGVLAAEEARRCGLTVAELSPGGPVDLGWRADADRYRAALLDALARDDVDAALVVFAPPVLERAERVAEAVDEIARTATKPLVASFLGDWLGNVEPDGALNGRTEGDRRHRRRSPVPRFRFPEQGARALGHVARYSRWRSEPEGSLPAFTDVDVEHAATVVSAALDAHPEGGPLSLADSLEVLRGGGIVPVGQVEVTSLDEALEAAARLGYPVALKAGLRPRFARTEETGLALGMHDADELSVTYERMCARLGAAMERALVQAMAPAGIDVQVIAHQDAQLGPLVALGRGGSAGSSPDELEVRLVPLTDLDASRLVAASPVAELIGRLESGAAIGRLEELLLRVSALVEAVPDLAEIRLDPVLVAPGALSITDLTVLVAHFATPGGPAVRRLEG